MIDAACAAVLQSNGFRKYVRDTNPRGCSMLFAPSEQIRSYQLYMLGCDDHPETKINGPAADQWASGVVMFQLLTGDLPFIPGKTKPLPLAPKQLDEDDQHDWQLYEDMRYLHRQWVSTPYCQYPLLASSLFLLTVLTPSFHIEL